MTRRGTDLVVAPARSVGRLLVGSAVFLSLAACAHRRVATPADPVLARHFASRGGAPALRSLEVVERVGTLTTFTQTGDEVRGRYRTCLRYGDAGVVDIDAGPMQVHEVVRNERAVRCDVHFLDCSPIEEGADLLRLVATTREANRELLYEPSRWTAPPHVEKSGATVIVTAHDREHGKVRYVFSEPAGLLSTKQRATEQGAERRHYLGWEKVEGVAFPRIIEQYSGPRLLYRVELEQVRVARDWSPWCAAIVDRAARHLD